MFMCNDMSDEQKYGVIMNVYITFSTKNGRENFLVLFINRQMILCARFVIYCSKHYSGEIVLFHVYKR